MASVNCYHPEQLVWLEGGHGLGDVNMDQFVEVMEHDVLAHAQPVH